MRTPTKGRADRVPTLDDVARLAGVSAATASRVLSNPAQVRPPARDAVGRAVAALGYVRHGAARALASRRSYLMGAVVPTIDNAIFAKCIQALQARLNAAGFGLLLATNEYDAGRELAAVRALLERGVDGLMLVGSARPPAIGRLLAAKRLPYVLSWSSISGGGQPSIGFDNRGAARRMAEYLLSLGHHRFGMIAGVTLGNDRAADRIAGVRDALQARGLELAPDCLTERSYAVSEGRAAMRTLMRNPAPPTAVICGNDILATGAVAECVALGVTVPGDVSVSGFDDLDIASCLAPPLTTMRVVAHEIGRRAAEALLAQVAGQGGGESVELDVELIVRGSTGPARPVPG